MEVRSVETPTLGISRDAVARLSERLGEPEWLRERRLAAWQSFEATPTPLMTDEEWRRTDIRKLDFGSFNVPIVAPSSYEPESSADHRNGFTQIADGYVMEHHLEPEVAAKGVVFSSTMGVYKPYDKPLSEEGVAALHEGLPLQPRDIYGYTKVAGEEMCRLYGREYGIPSVGLRYGMFVPEPFVRYGIRLLYGGVDARDVARAVMASLEALAAGRIHWGTFNVESVVPFTEEDGPQLHEDPLPVLDKYYPGATDLLRERGVESLSPIREYYPMKHAAEVLGFHPRCNFDRWLESLRERPEERAEKSPPWP